MKITQTYKYKEDGSGDVTVSFIISDSPNELFAEGTGDVFTTDIFMLNSIKKQLELEESKFAIDELTMEINEVSTLDNEDDQKILSILLNAANDRKNLYCMQCFGDVSEETEEDIIENNLVFSGMLVPEFSGNDIVHFGEEYSPEMHPYRAYNFTFHSMDMSVLELCKCTDTILDNDGEEVDNLYTRLSASSWSAVKALRIGRTSHLGYYGGNATYGMFNATATLSNNAKVSAIFDLMLSECENILNDIDGDTYTIQLENCDVPLRGKPQAISKFNSESDYNKYKGLSLFPTHLIDAQGTFDTDYTNSIKPIRIKGDEDNENYSQLCVHIGMVSPMVLDNGDEEDAWNQERLGKESNFKTYLSLDNIVEILSEFARSLLLIPKFQWLPNNTISIALVPRADIVEDEITYIRDTESASIDVKSEIDDDIPHYANRSTVWSNELSLVSAKTEIKGINDENYPKNDSNNVKSALHTIGTGVYKPNDLQDKSPRAVFINASCEPSTTEGKWGTPDYTLFRISNGTTYPYYQYLHITTNLFYIITEAPEEHQIEALMSPYVMRPLRSLFANIDGVDKEFYTIQQLLHYYQNNNKVKYSVEYELNVPFWTQFSKETDGSDAKWNNIRLGSVVRINERRLQKDGETWEYVTPYNDYIVVGIEYDLKKPNTKLSLVKQGKFNITDYVGSISSGIPDNAGIFPQANENDGYTSSIGFEIDTDEVISNGDAVFVNDDGKIGKATCLRGTDSVNYYRNVGIALASGEETEFIPVVFFGIVQRSDYSFTIGQAVWISNDDEADTNITQDRGDCFLNDGNMPIFLGVAITTDSFILTPKAEIWQ